MSDTRPDSALIPIERAFRRRLDPVDVIVTLLSQPNAFCFESACNTSGYGRYTILGIRPVAGLWMPVNSQAADRGPIDMLAAAMRRTPPVRAIGVPWVCQPRCWRC